MSKISLEEICSLNIGEVVNVLYKHLKEENEQLKQHNTELINKIDFLERIIDGDV